MCPVFSIVCYKSGFILRQLALHQCLKCSMLALIHSCSSCVLSGVICYVVLLCVLLSVTMAFQLLCCCSCATKINDHSACSAEKLPLFNCGYCEAGTSNLWGKKQHSASSFIHLTSS